MPAQCLQALDNGKPCNAPTVNGSPFCRHHDPHRAQKQVTTKSHEIEPLILPSLQDKCSILAALDQVVHALAEGRMKRSVADTLISGIKLATRLVTEISESGATMFPASMPAANAYRPMQPGPSFATESAGENVYEPTLLDLDEFKDTLQNGGPQQLRDQIVAKQTAWAKNRAARTSSTDRAAALLAVSRHLRREQSPIGFPTNKS